MMEDFRPDKPVEQTLPQQQETVVAAAQPPTFGVPQAGRPKPRLMLPAPHKRAHAWFMSLSRKWQIVVVVVTVLVLAGAAGGAVMALHKQPVQAGFDIKHRVIVKPPTTVQSTLTGLQVDPSVNARQVTGVMIENSTDARPQSGLDQAGVVFEALAEGGVTRFMALYQDSQPSYLGPVRSVRPYYLQWCQAFDCAIAHVGGSPDALQDVKDWGIKNLDQFAGGSYFTRVSSRAAPHNVYTSMAQLNSYEASRGYTSSTYTGFARLATEGKPSASAAVAHSINFNYQGTAYDVHYDYNAATNSYNRSEGGAAHTVVDATGTATQLSPKVVIAMAVPRSQGALDASGAYYSVYQDIGSGAAEVFQNGTVVSGSWTKSAPTSQIVFTDASGAVIKLNPGQTWITVLDAVGNASYN